jgi:pimeloyl-ACP methyl ester carboxylesterase
LMCSLVGPALRDGVRLFGGPVLSDGDVACAFYGDVFFESGSRADDVPPWDEFDVESDSRPSCWRRGGSTPLQRIPKWRALIGKGLVGRWVGCAVSRPLLHRRVRAALNALTESRYFERVSERLLIFELKQVRRYATEPGVRAAARERVAEAVGAETHVLVAHSLGSVVAYEALCANPRWPVTDFVTVGSPLGLRSVIFDRLDPAPVDGSGVWPAGVRRWTNIADPGDVVALAGVLAEQFDYRVDVPITNGARMHDLLRYSTAPSTGAAIARGLPESNELGEAEALT